MLVKVTIKRRNLFIVAIVAASLLIIIGLALLHVKKNSDGSGIKYYTRQLDKLKNSVNAINSLDSRQDTKSSISDQINKYNDTLSDMLGTCRQMDGHMEKPGDISAVSKPFKDNVDNIHKLCADLEKVTDYARKQSEATQDFLIYPSAKLNTQANLGAFQGILDIASSKLMNLKQDPIKDPAVPEQLKLLEQMGQQVKDAGGNPAKLSTLAKQVQIHQNDFLSTRTYFWKNTIEIDRLQNSITKLKDNFK